MQTTERKQRGKYGKQRKRGTLKNENGEGSRGKMVTSQEAKGTWNTKRQGDFKESSDAYKTNQTKNTRSNYMRKTTPPQAWERGRIARIERRKDPQRTKTDYLRLPGCTECKSKEEEGLVSEQRRGHGPGKHQQDAQQSRGNCRNTHSAVGGVAYYDAHKVLD
ncbi:DNA polymerase alpha catalytic subunit [Frankliniella fusca]|uniref:DNA polymerase alpha catalytic subunit n=1 Tax=Frankliniella fusca TaxID=407009 RepID=A0AAE1LDD3_9NEOP|nr:DNA polymerase alpha catalytic subunit [Frankliniella fusca]